MDIQRPRRPSGVSGRLFSLVGIIGIFAAIVAGATVWLVLTDPVTVAEDYRRWAPVTGYPMPGGVAGFKHQLVERDSYLAYALLRWAYRIAGVARRRTGRVMVPATDPVAVPGSVPAPRQRRRLNATAGPPR